MRVSYSWTGRKGTTLQKAPQVSTWEALDFLYKSSVSATELCNLHLK